MLRTPIDIKLIFVHLLQLSLFFGLSCNADDSEWSFIVIADWHDAERFAIEPGNISRNYRNKYKQIQNIKQTYGGDLVILPGDTQSGKWHNQAFANKFEPTLTVKKRILKAGKNCYGTIRSLFREAGYETILVAVGDHEIGGNKWAQNSIKTRATQDFREGFVEGLGSEEMFTKPIGATDSKPFGTPFQFTSYAYQHKSVLFITVDGFYKKPTDFIDKEKGLGGEGAVTCTVRGKHLEWFEKVLSEAEKDNTIKHIIVQAHLPIIQPVRKVSCSGQFMDYGEESAFWKAMVKYNVDIYFAGEVHTNTATRDPDSNLVQIVSRGNSINNFLKVEVTDYTLNITAYNEAGLKSRYNNNYVAYGNLMLDKLEIINRSIKNRSNGLPNLPSNTPNSSPSVELNFYHISSSVVLELLDRTSALVHLNFEQIVSLESRQVVGMHHDEDKDILVGRGITMRGIVCNNTLPNQGSFGQPYDAQVSGVQLVHAEKQSYGIFTANTRLGIYGTGPHGAGSKISYAIRIRTSRENTKMILVHYGHVFGFDPLHAHAKDILTLTLENGTPTLYVNTNSVLKPKPEHSQKLNDGKWHDIAVSMPSKSCTLSEVVMYVDRKIVETSEPENNEHIFFITSGRMSIGGFGYSHKSYEELFPDLKPYIGRIDYFRMWGRSIDENDLKLIAPSDSPSGFPTHTPSLEPSTEPSESHRPSTIPPSTIPSRFPSHVPSVSHSAKPSITPSASPSESPTRTPSLEPSTEPSASPTRSRPPSSTPSLAPSGDPTEIPSFKPSISCTNNPGCLFSEENRDTFCSYSNVRKKCPSTCGVDGCCVDSVGYLFIIRPGSKNPKKKGCPWIQDGIGMAEIDRKKYCKDDRVKKECMHSCGWCRENFVI